MKDIKVFQLFRFFTGEILSPLPPWGVRGVSPHFLPIKFKPSVA